MGRLVSRLRRAVGEIAAEHKGRRQGRRGLPQRPKHQAPREVIGPTGNMYSRGWEALAAGSKAFEKSFDRQIPPSLHISEQERHRFHLAIPVAERCLEDQAGRTEGQEEQRVQPGDPGAIGQRPESAQRDPEIGEPP